MSLKQEIETWVLALEYYDNQQYEEAIQVFDGIADTSKILFNCGVICATLGEHERAVECYQRAVGLDQYLAIAYFQEGVSNFLLGDFEEALANFNDTLLYLRGNTSIDYEQLGLKFRLFSCEVLFNRGLCYIYLQQMGLGLQDLEFASKEKVTQDHDVINDAIRERAEGYTVFSIPVGVVYRPNEAKVKNLKTKDYLGKARLIAASERSNTHMAPSRQHSEPPLNRSLFPPTPPPDTDKSSTHSSNNSQGGTITTGRSASVRAARPPRLDLDRPGANLGGRQNDPEAGEKPRIGTTRTASETRGQFARQEQQPRGLYIQNMGRQPGHWEPSGHKRGMSDTGYMPPIEDGYAEEPYGNYAPARRSLVMSTGGQSRKMMPRQQIQQYIDEEEEYASDACDEEDAAFDNEEFEIVGASRQRGHAPGTRVSRRSYTRRLEINKFRIKVHALEDKRYIMVGPTIQIAEFEKRIRDKFGFQSPLKLKMRDDGDMVSMVDQEDLDLLLMSAKEFARREGSEIGKTEIWVEVLPMF